MSSTDRRKKWASAANSPGWKLVAGRWLWWDGEQYTWEWDGDQCLALGKLLGTSPFAEHDTGLDPGERSAMASLVLGILGIPFFWFVFILPTLAIVFSLASRDRSHRAGFDWSGKAVGGLVLGIIGLLPLPPMLLVMNEAM